jgi:hypothetical protein
MPAPRRKLTQRDERGQAHIGERQRAALYSLAMAGHPPGDSKRPHDRARLPVKSESGKGESGGLPVRREEAFLYFFPDANVTPSQLQRILDQGSRAERCWAISHLLRYAQWDDIWLLVTRDEVRELLPEIELPDNLRAAWARILKVGAPVG